jgi:glycosyltransferase involved in cell wall biosynthesis
MTSETSAPEPLISCVTIFLNGEKYIGEAIESVLAQTRSDWELILVDDGTTDGATEIVRGYCDAHPGRIRLISHPGGGNLGMSASRNAGVRASRGRYVAFLDADDIWLPARLETHVAELERNTEAAMVMSPTVFWKSWNRKVAPWWRPWVCEDLSYCAGVVDRSVLRAPDVVTHFLRRRGGGVPGICSVTIRRPAFDEVGGCDDTFRTLYEDQVLIFKLFLEHPVIAVDDVLALYRQHPSSTCAAEGGLAGDRAARPVFLAWLKEWLEERGIDDEGLSEALDVEIARAGASFRPGPLRRLIALWQIESRQAVIWFLSPARYNRLRGRFGLTPLANDLEALITPQGRRVSR